MTDKDVSIAERKLFDAVEILASGDSTAYADLSKTTGKCKLQYAITGDGTIKLEVEESISGTYITKSPELGTTLTGSGIIAYDAAGIPLVRFKATEDGDSDPATITLWLSAL